jgi:bifunctional DNase/RNase
MPSDKQVLQVEVKAVLPTSGGCAVFLGNTEKVFVIYIDHSVGLAISMAMRREPRERPQTHDLIGSILAGFGAKIERVVINDFKAGVYYARLVVVAENELYERKIVEIDARPSDSIALAVTGKAPIYVTKHVWEDAEDMSELLQRMEERGSPFAGGDEPPPET